ncbi:hypothetical protein [Butyrivibrio sp. VCB2001]|uniref:hypothetical protein n=1 Tax=Butyrivibrio sp. VCB2001 TaxID=1280667 RepID=UPI00041E58F1|nr:hypothetical protein [Butyrivibrio sp. VCB2001]
MTKRTKITAMQHLGLIFFAAAIYCLIRSITLSITTDIWYDELFTMEFATRPVKELISLTARDVHPPFYYMIVRFFILVCDSLGFVGDGAFQLGAESVAKLVSVLPFFILMIYGATTIRKRFGILPAGLFSFAIITMPQMPEYTTEIRMYSWAMLFVTMALLHGFNLLDSIMGRGSKGWDTPNGLMLWLSTTAAAYTHYYAAFSIGIIYAVLVVWMLVYYMRVAKKKTDGKIGLKAAATLIVALNLTVASYIPWVSVVLSQTRAVKENYWIPPVGIRSLGSAIKHLFMGYFSNDLLAVITCVLLFILVTFLFVRTVIRIIRAKEITDAYTLFAFFILPLVVLTGLTVSFLLRPVFVNRYMLPAYGGFWLSVSVMASVEIDRVYKREKGQLIGKIAGVMLAVLMIIVGAVDYKTFIGNEEYRMVNIEKTLDMLDSINSDTIIISNFDQVQGILAYYLNKKDGDYKVYLYAAEPEALIKETVPGLETIDDPIDIKNYLDAGKEVLFLGSFNSREILLKEWNELYQITSENEGSYLMERYWFDVFRLSR